MTQQERQEGSALVEVPPKAQPKPFEFSRISSVFAAGAIASSSTSLDDLADQLTKGIREVERMLIDSPFHIEHFIDVDRDNEVQLGFSRFGSGWRLVVLDFESANSSEARVRPLDAAPLSLRTTCAGLLHVLCEELMQRHATETKTLQMALRSILTAKDKLKKGVQ
jgi:hypothetical protein